jgi:hypothetical protein
MPNVQAAGAVAPLTSSLSSEGAVTFFLEKQSHQLIENTGERSIIGQNNPNFVHSWVERLEAKSGTVETYRAPWERGHFARHFFLSDCRVRDNFEPSKSVWNSKYCTHSDSGIPWGFPVTESVTLQFRRLHLIENTSVQMDIFCHFDLSHL